MEYLITAYPSTPTPAMILTPPARAYSPSPAPEPEQEPIASTSQLQPSKRRVLDHVLLPRLPAGWLSAPPPAARVSEPVQDEKMCHQCRNQKNLHARYHCGRAGCVRAYCTSCLAKRYAWSPSDIHTQGCPGCRGVCNCSQCLDRAGLGRHKAFLTADARAGGCARKWLEERGLLVEGDGPPPTAAQRKKNMAKRPKILAKKQTDEEPKKKVKKTQPRPVDYYDDGDNHDDYDEGGANHPGSRGRWIIDAGAAVCAKFTKRWARERAARGAQVRAGTRRWFVGASPPPRPRARHAAAGAPPVETIDLTLDDDEDAPDSLFDAKSADGDARDKTEDADEKIADDVRAPDSPDSLFDEKTEDGDAPAQNDTGDDKDDAPASAQKDAPASAQKHAPDDKDDKDDDKDSLFDGDPATPAAHSPPSPQSAPAPIQLPSTPPQLPPTPIQLPSSPTPLQLPHTPTPLQLPPASPIISLSRSDSYADALRIDVELAVPSSPAKAPGSPANGAVEVRITFGDAFGASSTSPSAARAALGTASPVTTGLPPTSPVAALASPAATTSTASPVVQPKSPLESTGPASQPKTAASKAASAMFIPRAKPVAKRKRSDEDGADATRLESAKTRLESAKSSAGVLVALGRPGRKRVMEEEPQTDDGALLLKESLPAPEDRVQMQGDDVPVLLQTDDDTPAKDDVDLQASGKVDKPAQKDDALLQKDDAAGKKRPREDDTSTPDDARPAKRAALSKETAREPRAPSPGRADDYDVDDERAAPSNETARKPPRASSSRHEDSTIVDGLPTPKPTHTKHSAADALAQAMRAAYGGGAAASTPAASSVPVASGSTSNPTPAPTASASTSSAPVASSSSARNPPAPAKRSKPTVLAQRAAAQASGSSSSLAIALKTPAPAPSAASALAAAYKQAYAARAPSPASTLRSSPTPDPPENDRDGKASKPALHDELSTFIGRFDKDDEEPTPELLPSDLAAQSEGSSRTGPVSPVVAHRRPPIVVEDTDEEEMPARRPFVPCNPRRFVGMPLRFVPAKKRPRPSAKRVERAVIDLDTEDDDDDYKDDDEDDFGLARRRKRTKLWEQSVVQSQAHEPVIVLDDSDDSDFQPPGAPAPALANKGTGKGKGKSKSFGPGKGKGKTKPRKLPLSSFIAYSYTPPPAEPEEPMPEPVFVPDDDTAAAPPASEVWLGAAMAPLSPDLGLARAVADAWFSAV